MLSASLFIAAFIGSNAVVFRANSAIKVEVNAGKGKYGNSDCPCIGVDELEGATKVSLKDGNKSVDVNFPADLGASCDAWDAGVEDHPSCPGKSWCKQKWCYVDPCKCKNVADLPKPSSYLPKTMYQGKPLHYSYATCGATDEYTAEEKKKTLKDLEKTCAIKVDSATWGAEKCRCVGIGPQNGTTKVTIDGKLKDFPADTGAMCKKWEEDRHPSCLGKSPPSWCSQAWCYVDPCSCNLPTPPKTSSYLPESKYQGKPIYYSYQTCGGTDSYTSSTYKDACVNQKTSAHCGNLAKCAWTGKECLGKELVEVCKVKVEEAKKPEAKKPEAKKPQAKKAEKALPVGTGAHQNGKAVKQRTQSGNMDCEHGNWNDCHGPGGDFANDGPKKAPRKSGAAGLGLSGLAALVIALAQ